ncbi:hypothetical protein PHMEG_00041265 [Phytophthora megakarya]|uniref:Uncharacterized protein n=1 Tax=Phytophthora megakarya TaxID=4795 RepID=A0A225UC28_9STRA|nr:hypothetical protein PHMEG_00041265 [Phytophthora megakarya]
MARVVLENPFVWSKYLRMFDLSAKVSLRNIVDTGAYRTFDVSYPSQTNRAFHMQSSWQSQKVEQIQNASLIMRSTYDELRLLRSSG